MRSPTGHRSASEAAARSLAALLGALVVLVFVAVASSNRWAWATACAGEQVHAPEDLAAVADAHRAGTTFCIHDSADPYSVATRIVVEDRDRFIGLYSDGTRVGILTDTADHIFDTEGANNAYISGFHVQGAVHHDSCEPDCGRGIGGGGKNLTVEDVRASHNENQGIGGTGPGLRVRDSEFDHNGSDDAAADGGKVSAAGIKSVNSMRIIGSSFRDNYWDGVWCDIECGRLEVRDSVFEGNGKSGIHYEISTGPAIIEGNTLRNNGGGSQARTTRTGGVLIVGSSNVRVYGNTFKGNRSNGIEVTGDARTAHVIDNVRIHNNRLNGDSVEGYTPTGEQCIDLLFVKVCPSGSYWRLKPF